MVRECGERPYIKTPPGVPNPPRHPPRLSPPASSAAPGRGLRGLGQEGEAPAPALRDAGRGHVPGAGDLRGAALGRRGARGARGARGLGREAFGPKWATERQLWF